MRANALVALSGGVDSSISLIRALSQFRKVRAVFLRMGHRDSSAAQKVAKQLGVKLQIKDASRIFADHVIKPAQKLMAEGYTPNPCALCNSRVKFRIIFEMLEAGESLVTGHYVRVSGSIIHRGLDRNKDQSYFLALVPGEIIRRCRFPLGEEKKSEVRREAIQKELYFQHKESQDLCFSPFDNQKKPLEKPGEIVNSSNNVLGFHRGLAFYTVGQRKGLGIAAEKPLYVIKLDLPTNRVIVGSESELYSKQCLIEKFNWIAEPPSNGKFNADVQIRFRKSAAPAEVEIKSNLIEVKFNKPQKAVAPGQIGAIYVDDMLLGGGLILNRL